MKKSCLFIVLSVLTVILTSCKEKTTQADNGWTDDALQMPEGIKESDLPSPGSEGARLMAHYCSQCHGIPSPASHSAADWVPVFRRMVLRMERSNHMGPMMGGGMTGGMMSRGMHNAEVPAENEQSIILRYLQSNALIAVASGEIPEAGGEDAALFRQKCSRCHALPAPDQYTAADWPDVVNRMQQHMKTMHIPLLTDQEVSEISRYLQRNAR